MIRVPVAIKQVEDCVNNSDLPQKTPSAVHKSDDLPSPETHRLWLKRHIGPLPDGDTFARYESVLPGAADRVIKMAEKEQSHEHAQESRLLRYEALLTLVGQFFGFAIGMAGIIGGVTLASQDKSLVGFGIFFTSLASLVGAYLYRCSKPEKIVEQEDQRKNERS